ncbi:MAG: universal stress protein [Paenisporosarcina sp.]
MIQKMIVGYDGSDGSRAALLKAVGLMQHIPNTQLTVAYVNEDVVGGEIAYIGQQVESSPLSMDLTNVPPVEKEYDSPRQFAREYAVQMSESIQEQLDKHLIKANIVAIDGHPTHALADMADKEQADLIIVGNSGKSGFQKFFVGSISEKLIKEAHCSVLVVK